MPTLNSVHRLRSSTAAYDAEGAPIPATELEATGLGAARCICGEQSRDVFPDDRDTWITAHRAAVVWQIQHGDRPSEGYDLPAPVPPLDTAE